MLILAHVLGSVLTTAILQILFVRRGSERTNEVAFANALFWFALLLMGKWLEWGGTTGPYTEDDPNVSAISAFLLFWTVLLLPVAQYAQRFAKRDSRSRDRSDMKKPR